MKSIVGVAFALLAITPLAAQVPCHAENDGNNFNNAASMGGPNLLIAIRFDAPAALSVTSIEVFTGEGNGQNSLAIWSHDPGGNLPSGSLGLGTWNMSTTNSWQGTTIQPSVALTVGKSVACQFWGRDSVATGSFLSDGITYVVGP
jgi:hypothetical protein